MTHRIVVRTYEHLWKYALAWALGKHNLLIVVGDPGNGKTETFRAAVGQEGALPCFRVEGAVSAWGLYRNLYWHRDENVLCDDADVFKKPDLVVLLKNLGQTTEVKTLGWNTGHHQIADPDDDEGEGILREFETRSRLAIIVNDFGVINKNLAAVADRGIVIEFKPSAETLHAEAGKWFRDPKIYDFIGRHLHSIVHPSLRHYAKAQELKAAEHDWRDYLLATWGLEEKERLVFALSADRKFRTENDRAREFERLTGCCRATYFNVKKRLGLSKRRVKTA